MSTTLRRTIATKLGHNLLLVLTLAVVVLFSLAGQDKTSAIRPAVVDSSTALVEAHDCGDHVDDPTHAVVTAKGRTRYVGQRMTDRAIEQAVFGIDHGLTVHEFCA